MSAVTTCPSCEQPLWVTEEMLGKTVSCLYCGKEFVARAGEGGRPAAAAAPTAAEPAKAMPAGGRAEVRPATPSRPREEKRVSELPAELKGYYDRIVERLSSAGYALEFDVPAVDRAFRERLAMDGYSFRYEFPGLGPNHLCVGRRFNYSLLSVIGFIEVVFLVAPVKEADAGLVHGFAERGRIYALVRKSRTTKGFLPVLFLCAIPVLLAERVDLSVGELFRQKKLSIFAESLAFPVVYDAAKQEIDYCRKSPLIGSMNYDGARRLAARLLAP
jgi:hypothetical protein